MNIFSGSPPIFCVPITFTKAFTISPPTVKKKKSHAPNYKAQRRHTNVWTPTFSIVPDTYLEGHNACGTQHKYTMVNGEHSLP